MGSIRIPEIDMVDLSSDSGAKYEMHGGRQGSISYSNGAQGGLQSPASASSASSAHLYLSGTTSLSLPSNDHDYNLSAELVRTYNEVRTKEPNPPREDDDDDDDEDEDEGFVFGVPARHRVASRVSPEEAREPKYLTRLHKDRSEIDRQQVARSAQLREQAVSKRIAESVVPPKKPCQITNDVFQPLHSEPNYDVLTRLPDMAIKDKREQLKHHVRDLKCIQGVAEETARYQCMGPVEAKIEGELEELRGFARKVLAGEVHTTVGRKRIQDINDNMKRRINRTRVNKSMNRADYEEFLQQTTKDQLASHAALVLGDNVYSEIRGAIGPTEERGREIRNIYRVEQNKAYKTKYRKPKKLKGPSRIERLEQLKRAYETAEETARSSKNAEAEQVIEFNDISESEIELTSDEDEEPSEYQARKKRAQEARHREKFETRAAAHNAQLRAEKAKSLDEHRRTNYEDQRISRGTFNAAKELPPGFDRGRIFLEHKQHFDERDAPPAGISTAGQGRLPSPVPTAAVEYLESDDEAAITGHKDAVLVDSDSDSSVTNIAEECFEYLVKGQKTNFLLNHSPEREELDRVYGRYLDLPSAHTRISHLVGRLPISAADAQGGARVISELSSNDFHLLDQTVTFFNTGKTIRFWIERRLVYAEGTAKKRSFTPKTLYQVHEAQTVTGQTPTNACTPIYTSLSQANAAAIDAFLALCAAACPAASPAFWDSRRTLLQAEYAAGKPGEEEGERAFDEKKVFSEIGGGRKGKMVKGGKGGKGLEVTKMEEVRVWVQGVEVVGPRN